MKIGTWRSRSGFAGCSLSFYEIKEILFGPNLVQGIKAEEVKKKREKKFLKGILLSQGRVSTFLVI